MQIGQETIRLAMFVMAPIFIIGLAVGIFVSLAQAVFQVQDSTIGTIPKIMAIGASLLLFGNWMLTHLMQYSQHYLGNFTNFIQ